MKIEAGQVMAVTGGGSGIGRELALLCASRGMAVAIGDIELDAADQTVAMIETQGGRAIASRLDVTNPESVEEFAARVFDGLGGCHLLCNNAGVLVLGTLDSATAADWSWVMNVNLFGIIHGIDAFLPRMQAMGKPGHILNTVSLRGIASSRGCGVYAASKFAALGLTETLRAELNGSDIGVTALCPWSVDTAIVASERNRPDAAGGMSSEELQRLIDAAPASNITIGADQAARIAIEAVENNEFWAITHPCAHDMLKGRFDEIMQSLDRVRQRHPELP